MRVQRAGLRLKGFQGFIDVGFRCLMMADLFTVHVTSRHNSILHGRCPGKDLPQQESSDPFQDGIVRKMVRTIPNLPLSLYPFPDPREDPTSRSLNGASYAVPLVV